MVSNVPKTRPAYPDEFRREAVQMLRAGRTPRELAQSLGVSEQTLRNWRREDLADRRERTDVPTSGEFANSRLSARRSPRATRTRRQTTDSRTTRQPARPAGPNTPA